MHSLDTQQQNTRPETAVDLRLCYCTIQGTSIFVHNNLESHTNGVVLLINNILKGHILT